MGILFKYYIIFNISFWTNLTLQSKNEYELPINNPLECLYLCSLY
jgi:hypothetical protein